ncbi:MAG: glutathione S-transferase N-terminal domain-containing protein [Candidatus Aureabacteria bacterium]|nr:glutathione S-transferase N-terminal domain-containing protein [Candidatus Auribacterota bacterium]
MDIKVYSTPTCPYCIRVKEFISSKGFSYNDIDVSSNPEAAQEMVKASGQMGVPVIMIDQEVIIGFDREKITSLLDS